MVAHHAMDGLFLMVCLSSSCVSPTSSLCSCSRPVELGGSAVVWLKLLIYATICAASQDEHGFASKVSPINLDMDNGVTSTMLSIYNHSRSPSLSMLRTW